MIEDQELTFLIALHRRASVPSLEDATKAAEDLPCIVEEADSLASIIQKHRRWTFNCKSLLEGYFKGDITLPLTPDTAMEPDEAQGIVDNGITAHSLPAGHRPESVAEASATAVRPGPPSGTALQSKISSFELTTDSRGADKDGEPSWRTQKTADMPQGSVKAGTADEEAPLEGLSQDREGQAQAAEEGKEVLREAEQGAPARAEKEEQDQHGKGPPRRTSLSLRTLNQLLKSALSLELDMGDTPERVLDALRLHQWRMKASAALKPGTKFTGTSFSAKLQNCPEAVFASWQRQV